MVKLTLKSIYKSDILNNLADSKHVILTMIIFCFAR